MIVERLLPTAEAYDLVALTDRKSVGPGQVSVWRAVTGPRTGTGYVA